MQTLENQARMARDPDVQRELQKCAEEELQRWKDTIAANVAEFTALHEQLGQMLPGE